MRLRPASYRLLVEIPHYAEAYALATIAKNMVARRIWFEALDGDGNPIVGEEYDWPLFGPNVLGGEPMTDKIRIVGSFAEDVADKVREFVKNLEGVQHVEVLKSGVDTYQAGESEETATEGAPEPAEATETPETTEEQSEAPEAPTAA